MNKQLNFSFAKAVPFLLVVLIGAALTFGIVWVTSQPEVILAKGEWANATANLFNAKQTYHQQLPEILSKATILAVSGFLAFATLAFVLSVSVNLVIHNVDRVVAHGWEFEKNAGGQKTTYKLFHSNPVPYKLGPGQQPRITVEPGIGGMLGMGAGGNAQQLPRNIPQQGRKLRPEERRTPGKNPNHNNGPLHPQEQIYPGLGSDTQPELSKADPLSMLEDTQLI